MAFSTSTTYKNFIPHRNQNYQQIKTQLLRSGEKFVDKEFLPNEYSLYPNSQKKNKNITWKRAQV